MQYITAISHKDDYEMAQLCQRVTELWDHYIDAHCSNVFLHWYVLPLVHTIANIFPGGMCPISISFLLYILLATKSQYKLHDHSQKSVSRNLIYWITSSLVDHDHMWHQLSGNYGNKALSRRMCSRTFNISDKKRRMWLPDTPKGPRDIYENSFSPCMFVRFIGIVATRGLQHPNEGVLFHLSQKPIYLQAKDQSKMYPFCTAVQCT